MEIYDSTDYVDMHKNKDFLKLAVINQWDWISQAVCYQTLKSFNNDVLISYKLQRHRLISENQGVVEDINELTKEMKEHLISKGYRVPEQNAHQ